jgi:(Z)-2-((N-methylformamido)methylene)-5-hydroxybutyrolactone dehydrogenase
MADAVTDRRMYVDGNWVEARDGAWIETVNPYTTEVWARVPKASADDVDAAVRAASRAYHEVWRHTTGFERAEYLRRIARLVAENADDLSRFESTDNGKPVRETGPQARASGRTFEYFAGLADKVGGQVIPLENKGVFDYTVRVPYGVVACLTAWNSPLFLMATKVATALAAGNTVVVKPSELASVSTLEFMRVIEAADLPPGVFNVITGTGGEAGAGLVSHPGVGKVSLTGGPETGRRVNALIAEDLRPGVFELGGKSANIVFADADLDEAANGALAGIFAAGGQTCVAGSRLLLQDAIHDQVLETIADRAGDIRMGDPLDPETQLGPLATTAQVERMKGFVASALEEGARLVVGGDVATGNRGNFFQPTIFADVTNDMRIAREEIFGPILSVIRFSDEDEALAIANDSDYGLAAGVWSSDIRRIFRMTEALDVGMVWANTYRATTFAAPFGGTKASGYGRERGAESIHEFTTVKNVMIDIGAGVGDPFSTRV